jgi:site-specific recombinase XerD
MDVTEYAQIITSTRVAEDPLLRGLYAFVAGKSHYTGRSYKTAIQMYIDFLGGDVHAIESADAFVVTRFKQHLQKQYSDATVGQRLSAISSMYRYLVKQQIMDHNPVLLIERGDVKVNPYEHARTITIEQFNDILINIPDTVAGKRDQAIFMMLYLSGLRRSSVLNLTGKDIQFAHGKVFFKTRLKGGRSATKELPQPVWVLIEDYLNAAGRTLQDDEAVFLPTTDAGDILIAYHGRKHVSKGLSPELINQKFKRYAKNAGVPGVSAHALRHLGAAMYYEASKDIVETMNFLNHKHVNTTQVYLQSLQGEEHDHWQAMMKHIYQ